MARPWNPSPALLTTLFALCLLPPGSALADEHRELEYSRPGLYVKGAAQYVVWTSREAFAPAPDVEWQSDFGLDVAVGWRNSERLALEVEFEWVVNHNDASRGFWLLGANGKFYFLEDRIQPYLILGAGGAWAKVPDFDGFRDDWAFRQGLGVDYYLDEHWAISGESTFVWGVGDLWKNYFVTFSVGAMYRF